MANPFKKVEDFENEINDFLIRNKTFIADQGKRISDYFEMSCYNQVVRFYEKKDYQLEVKNLIANKFKYKLSPNGYPENFSFFEVKYYEQIGEKEKESYFEIHHNLTIQSSFQEDIYLTPDIAIINKDSIISDEDHYLVKNSKKKFCYVSNSDLQTFCEVKNFNPFPELLFNFIGLYNELKKSAIEEGGTSNVELPKHLAPSLMISGKGNLHADRIKESLENRYAINIFFDLFEHNIGSSSNIKSQFQKLIGSTNVSKETIVKEKEDEKILDEDDLPF